MSYKEDVVTISRLLGAYKLGVICDPWMADSLMADIPANIKFIHPDHPEDIEGCKALFLHSQWPDEGPWSGEIQPKIGAKLWQLLSFCKNREHAPYKPVIYWHLEGSEGSYKMFRHLMDIADVCGFITAADHLRSSCKKKTVLQMGASYNIFSKPHKSFDKTDGVLFTGRWYADNIERCELLEVAKNVCDENDIKFRITSWGDRSTWPAHFHPYLFPKVPFDGLATLYSQYRVGLNTNLWPGAISMRYPCMAMAGLPVVGNNTREQLLALYNNREMWSAASRSIKAIATQTHRLTQKIANLLKLALEG